ncbi:AmmeMemoRadiSam system protein A [Lentisphaerota bacterium ZTH]|nr:AmmeMemoRadiSam system protein A [Lentisphaerota bacterium]WET06844.1 AmmeMemoRadiSam system protein A [Lentisphaerota bacterium ZTH]
MSTKELFDPVEQSEILRYVREMIHTRFDDSISPEISAMDGKLEEEMSCFVTLHSANGMLRGCIGNIAAFEPLAENLARNAINAAFNDPRFPPVAVDEIDELEIEVSVLTPMQKIDSANEFEVGKHGIVLRCNTRSAVFLPQVAPEQGWDAATTLTHLSMKAGLHPDSWKSPDAEFEVFEAFVFSEKDVS